MCYLYKIEAGKDSLSLTAKAKVHTLKENSGEFEYINIKQFFWRNC